MDKRTTYQDVPLGEHTFRLRKLDARTGTWLYSLLTAKASPDGEPVKLMQLLTAFHSCSKSEYAEIQNEVLKCVSLIEQSEGKEFESVILAPTGSGFSFAFLNDEVTTVYQLTDMQVVENVSPFFKEKPSNSTPLPIPPDGSR